MNLFLSVLLVALLILLHYQTLVLPERPDEFIRVILDFLMVFLGAYLAFYLYRTRERKQKYEEYLNNLQASFLELKYARMSFGNLLRGLETIPIDDVANFSENYNFALASIKDVDFISVQKTIQSGCAGDVETLNLLQKSLYNVQLVINGLEISGKVFDEQGALEKMFAFSIVTRNSMLLLKEKEKVGVVIDYIDESLRKIEEILSKNNIVFLEDEDK